MPADDFEGEKTEKKHEIHSILLKLVEISRKLNQIDRKTKKIFKNYFLTKKKKQKTRGQSLWKPKKWTESFDFVHLMRMRREEQTKKIFFFKKCSFLMKNQGRNSWQGDQRCIESIILRA